MPQISLETTADLPENAHVPDILESLATEICRFDGVASASVKAYHTLRSVWVMGEGAPAGFAMLTIGVLTGRSVEWRKSLSTGMFEVMQRHFSESLEAGEVKITVEIREMERESYSR